MSNIEINICTYSFTSLRGVSNVDRHLNQAIAAIREMSERINIPRGIQDRAIKVFKDMLETECLKGKSNEAQVRKYTPWGNYITITVYWSLES